VEDYNTREKKQKKKEKTIKKDRKRILKNFFYSVFLPERFIPPMIYGKLPLRCLFKNLPEFCPTRVPLPESLNILYILPLRPLF